MTDEDALAKDLRLIAECDGEHRYSRKLREAADAIDYWKQRSGSFERELDAARDPLKERSDD